MADRITVMSWLVGLSQDDWMKWHSDSEVQEIARSALALLKRQETQKFLVDEKGKITPLPIVYPNCPLKEQEAKWVYGEDGTGVDGWYCSECNFFEPWFYDFDDDIDFIKRYEHCPKCGRRMTSYTGKYEEESRKVGKVNV